MISFALAPAMVSYDWADGNRLNEVEAHYLEFVVDGRPLSDLMDESDRHSYVTDLCRLWPREAVQDAVEYLLGRRPTPYLDEGRVAIFVCRMCGDLGCGALTARLSFEGDTVCWSDWLWESFGDPQPAPQLFEPMCFDRRQYEESLSGALAQVAAMPYDQVAMRGRRILWPWQWGWRLAPPVKRRPWTPEQG